MPRDDSSETGKTSRTSNFRRLRRGGHRFAMPWLSLRRWRRRAALVGAAMLAGLVAIIFAITAELAISGHERLMQISPWLTLVIAPAGFAATAYLARKYFAGTQGSGIPQTIAASITDDDKLRRALLSPRILVGKILLTLGGLLSGATIGREGPSVQVGASVLNTLSGKKRGRIAPTRDLIIAGGAAGVAAAFNTPLGGIMFAIEELSRNRPFMANSMTLIAVIFSGLMSLATLGTYTYFGTTHATMSWPYAMWPVIACGAGGGILGGLFTRLLIKTTRNLPGRLGAFARAFPVRFAAMCGLGTALIGLATGGLSYGTGYAEIKGALEGTEQLPLYYALAKAGAILLAFVSGIPGGLFAPALAVGAGLGADAAPFFPEAQSSAVLALGMVAFLAGVTQSPITAFVIVMEMTANHSLLLPLMCASVISNAFSRSMAPTPLYDAMAFTILRRHNAVKRGQLNMAAQRRQKEERAAAEQAAAEQAAAEPEFAARHAAGPAVPKKSEAAPSPPALLEQPAILLPLRSEGGFASPPQSVAAPTGPRPKRGLPPIAAIFKRRDRIVPALNRPPRPLGNGDAEIEPDEAEGDDPIPPTPAVAAEAAADVPGSAPAASQVLPADTTMAHADDAPDRGDDVLSGGEIAGHEIDDEQVAVEASAASEADSAAATVEAADLSRIDGTAPDEDAESTPADTAEGGEQVDEAPAKTRQGRRWFGLFGRRRREGNA